MKNYQQTHKDIKPIINLRLNLKKKQIKSEK